jgi:hypothetical protein
LGPIPNPQSPFTSGSIIIIIFWHKEINLPPKYNFNLI